MHIPSTMLSSTICPVTMVLSVGGIALAASLAKRSEHKPSSITFAAVTALIFALQILNYPVQDGTSGHFIGAMFAVALLGIPFAVLSMSSVLIMQACFFGDGGTMALGANILNMAITAAGGIGCFYYLMKKKGINEKLSLGAAAFLSAIAAASMCSLELAFSGAVPLSKVLPAMVSVHAFIGVGEAILTVLLVSLLHAIVRRNENSDSHLAIVAFSLAVVAVFMSPFASSFPDALEWLAGDLSFVTFSGFEIPAIFPNYQASFVAHQGISTIVAGIAGVMMICGFTLSLEKMLVVQKGEK